MPDGAASPRAGDPADERALAADGRLIRGVRWRLVLWSGLTHAGRPRGPRRRALRQSPAGTLETNGKTSSTTGSSRSSPAREPATPAGGPGLRVHLRRQLVRDVRRRRRRGRQQRRPRAGSPAAGLPVADCRSRPRSHGRDSARASVQTIDADDRLDASSRSASSPSGRSARSSAPVYIQVIQDRTAEQQTLDAIRTVLLDRRPARSSSSRSGSARSTPAAPSSRSASRSSSSARRSAASASSPRTRATSCGRR